jgi:hypothetical protein
MLKVTNTIDFFDPIFTLPLFKLYSEKSEVLLSTCVNSGDKMIKGVQPPSPAKDCVFLSRNNPEIHIRTHLLITQQIVIARYAVFILSRAAKGDTRNWAVGEIVIIACL